MSGEDVKLLAMAKIGIFKVLIIERCKHHC